ncbi:VCBS repeat-containing protein [soil metagenome]
MIRSIIFSLFTFVVYTSNAQNFFAQDNSIPVFNGSRQMKFPWVGGLNNPQFAAADLNGDGIDDLVIFNRGSVDGGHIILPFINGGTPNQVDYSYAPEYVGDLPDLHHWMLSMDYNCDGVPDFITWETPGLMALYVGTRNSNGRLSYTRKGFLNYTTETGTTETNIYVSPVDIPAMIDVNDDGDLDVLTFSPVGFRVEYYENLSVETGNGCGDTLGFDIKSYCWDEFSESGITQAVDLFEPCGSPKDGGGEGAARHTGSALLAFDENADGPKELILGDISFNNLVKLDNGGRLDSAYAVAQDTFFPAYDRPAIVPIFPAAFYVDVDNDSRKDLLVAPNTPKKGVNYNCSWFYKDVSTNANVVFNFQTDTFMVNDMIDVGEGAYPAFVDVNADGLVDMVVGNNGYYESTSSSISGMALFINVGTATAPVFRLVDRDYMGFSSYLTGGVKLQSLTPAFYDMNGDGAMDMIIGDHQGYLHYFRNTAPAGDSMSLVLEEHRFKNIDIGNYARPEIFDVNADGLPDLIVGRVTGTLHYFENIGTRTNPNFSSVPSNAAFGEVNVKDNLPNGNSTPKVVYLAHNSQPYLLVGNIMGNVAVYELDAAKRYNGAFNKPYTVYSGMDVGEYADIAIADINNDGRWDMAVGSSRGGISFYKETDHVGLLESPATDIGVKAFPNPSDGNWQLALDGLMTNQMVEVAIYDVLGQKVFETSYLPMDAKVVLPIHLDVSTGVYFCRVNQGKNNTILRLSAN